MIDHGHAFQSKPSGHRFASASTTACAAQPGWAVNIKRSHPCCDARVGRLLECTGPGPDRRSTTL